jgi:hypothetical protein
MKKRHAKGRGTRLPNIKAITLAISSMAVGVRGSNVMMKVRMVVGHAYAPNVLQLHDRQGRGTDGDRVS